MINSFYHRKWFYECVRWGAWLCVALGVALMVVHVRSMPKASAMRWFSHLENPLFYGRDNRANTFRLGAQHASQRRKDEFVFRTPWADIRPHSHNTVLPWVRLRGQNGVYHSRHAQLDFSGPVVVTSSDRGTIQSRDVHALMRKGRVWSSAPSHGRGQEMDFDAAAGFAVTPEALNLYGNSRLVFHLDDEA